MTLSLAIATLILAASASAHNRYKSFPMPAKWKPTPAFLKQALCVHRHESVDWHRRWTDWRGNRSPYAGGMQFLQSTWRRAGGRGEPWQASPREQMYRAWVIVRSHNGSWVEWGTRGKCGLR